MEFNESLRYHEQDLGSAICVLALLALSGCESKDQAESIVKSEIRREGKPPVENISNDNAQMKAAIQKARSTVKSFISALAKPKAGQKDFAVKVLFEDGEHDEHMWLAPVRFQNGKIHGYSQQQTG